MASGHTKCRRRIPDQCSQVTEQAPTPLLGMAFHVLATEFHDVVQARQSFRGDQTWSGIRVKFPRTLCLLRPSGYIPYPYSSLTSYLALPSIVFHEVSVPATAVAPLHEEKFQLMKKNSEVSQFNFRICSTGRPSHAPRLCTSSSHASRRVPPTFITSKIEAIA